MPQSGVGPCLQLQLEYCNVSISVRPQAETKQFERFVEAHTGGAVRNMQSFRQFPVKLPQFALQKLEGRYQDIKSLSVMMSIKPITNPDARLFHMTTRFTQTWLLQLLSLKAAPYLLLALPTSSGKSTRTKIKSLLKQSSWPMNSSKKRGGAKNDKRRGKSKESNARSNCDARLVKKSSRMPKRTLQTPQMAR